MIGNKKHYFIAGATGLVGSALLEKLLQDTDVGKVSITTRRPLDLEHDKLQIFEVDYESVTEKVIPSNVDAVFICLGTTMAQAGGKDAFRQVDYAYVVKLAVYAQRRGISQLHIVSATGANPDSKIFYNKVKGRMELEVRKLQKLRSIYFYRPSMLLGERDQFRFGESLGKVFMRAFSFLIPKSHKAIYDFEVAEAMHFFSKSPKKGQHIISNAEMINMSRNR